MWGLPVSAFMLAVPLAYATGAAGVLLWPRDPGKCWRWAGAAGAMASIAALSASALSMVSSFAVTAAHEQGLRPLVSSDAIALAMLALVATLGWMIVRYSRTYLEGEQGQPAYASALMLTLAAVSLVALTDHLGVLLTAWIASSLGLHRLLTFYRGRPAAIIVAHKKFIASRIAELCLAGALLLLYRETGTLSIAGIAAQLRALTELPWTLQAAAAFIALAAILKSAQLPVHGWLIQVMEAPTPVSALLHAGIVNLAGFVLIRQGELLSAAPMAQMILVVVGSLTALLAGLAMMTQTSIKVRLAWSTCSQMGFMLMECGLGLYALAFLHLVAHSLYKAHAFLGAGDAVRDVCRRRLMPANVEGSVGVRLFTRLAAAPAAIALVTASVAGWGYAVRGFELPEVAVLIVGLALAPLLWPQTGSTLAAAGRGAIRVIALAQFYICWHIAFGALVTVPEIPIPMPATLWVGICFSLLYAVTVWLQVFPTGALSNALHPWAYAGFHLDALFTRLTFRLWPARASAVADYKLAGERA